MTDKHSAEFFSKAHFWVEIDLFDMYNLPMQQGKQKYSIFYENFAIFLFHLYRYIMKHFLHYDIGIPLILL